MCYWPGFLGGISPLLPGDSKPKSAHFLSLATRLSETGHEERFSESFKSYGLAADIPISHVDVGLKSAHPILAISDTVQRLGVHGKMELLTMGNSESNFDSFWKEWEQVQPKHPLYMTHKGRTGQCIPIAIHCDEGTTLKKIDYDHPVPAGHGTWNPQAEGHT